MARKVFSLLQKQERIELIQGMVRNDGNLLKKIVVADDFLKRGKRFFIEMVRLSLEYKKRESYEYLLDIANFFDINKMFEKLAMGLDKSMAKFFVECYSELSEENVGTLALNLEVNYEKLFKEVSNSFISKACAWKNVDVVDAVFPLLLERKNYQLLADVLDGLVIGRSMHSNFIKQCEEAGDTLALEIVLSIPSCVR